MTIHQRHRRRLAAALGEADGQPIPGRGQARAYRIPDTDEGIRKFEIPQMVEYVLKFRSDPDVVRLSRRIVQLCDAKNKDCEVMGLFLWVKDHIRYVNDVVNGEVIQTAASHIAEITTPPELIEMILGPKLISALRGEYGIGVGHEIFTPPNSVDCPTCFQDTIGGPLARTSGDCIPFDQKVVVQNIESREVMAIPAGDLRGGNYMLYNAVSFNEKTGKQEFKRIERFIDKGRLGTWQITLKDGTKFRCTENHLLYVYEDGPSGDLTTMALKKFILGFDAKFGSSLRLARVSKDGASPEIIESIEMFDAEECCDLTVADNHNFLLEGGILVHNCDEGSTFLATLLAAVGITPRFRFGGSMGAAGEPSWQHVWVQAYNDRAREWVDLDVTEKESTVGWFYRHFPQYGNVKIF